MKRIVSIVFFCFASVAFISCQDNGPKGPVINKSISVKEYDSMLQANPNAQIVDVRSTEEYNGGHLKNARNIDINSTGFREQVYSLNKKKPVMLYCLSGGRSSEAAKQLKEMGFAEVYNMEGGLVKWKADGKAVETGSASKLSGMTKHEFDKEVNKSTYVLVDFNAQWCGPCKKLSPILDELAAKKADKLTLMKIDADQNPVLLDEKKIEGIPYLELYKNGQLVWKHEGFITEADLLKETQL